MKNKIINLLLLASIVVIALFVFNQQEEKEYDREDIANISKVFKKKLEFARQEHERPVKPKAAFKSPHPKIDKSRSNRVDNIDASRSRPSIIGVIYQKSDATWFIKAKDSSDNINTISASFKNYFVDQLKFDQQNHPIFSHIPDGMKAENTSSMRVATFKIGEVEVSVSKLSGQQDVYANVRRWMNQVGITDDSEINLNFSDDKKTIMVKMPR